MIGGKIYSLILLENWHEARNFLIKRPRRHAKVARAFDTPIVMMKVARAMKRITRKIVISAIQKRRTLVILIFDDHCCVLQFPGECILTYMEFQLDSAEYCQAQHKQRDTPILPDNYQISLKRGEEDSKHLGGRKKDIGSSREIITGEARKIINQSSRKTQENLIEIINLPQQMQAQSQILSAPVSQGAPSAKQVSVVESKQERKKKTFIINI